MKKIIVGSRDSRLAVIQSQMVIDFLRKRVPEADIELLTMKTSGDKILDKTLDKIGGKGLFVRELDMALREGRSDLSVHSLKDLPMETEEDLPLLAFSRREDPRDVLVLPRGKREMDKSLPIGTSSKRRIYQLQALFPRMDFLPVRGNLQTRLDKLDGGGYAALVLAAAGLKRLGLEDRISRYFDVEEIIPSAGQGILAVQAGSPAQEGGAVHRGEGHFLEKKSGKTDFLREKFSLNELKVLLCDFSDPEAESAALAERSLVRALGGGCSSPIAAHAVLSGRMIRLLSFFGTEDGSRTFREEMCGQIGEEETLGRLLAEKIRSRLSD